MPEETQPTPEPTPKPPKQPDPAPAAMFTQADMDRVAGDRAVRAKEAAYSELIKELGFDDLDKLKETAKEAKKRKDDELSASEKLQKELDKLKAEKEDALKQANEEKAARILERRDNTIKAALTAARATAADDVLYLMERKFPDLVKATVNEDGTMNTKAVDALVAKAKTERKQDFIGTGPGIPSASGGRTPDGKIDFGKQPIVKF